jgi:hypothetical protein
MLSRSGEPKANVLSSLVARLRLVGPGATPLQLETWEDDGGSAPAPVAAARNAPSRPDGAVAPPPIATRAETDLALVTLAHEMRSPLAAIRFGTLLLS